MSLISSITSKIDFGSILGSLGSTVVNAAKNALTSAVGNYAPDIFSGLANKAFGAITSKLGLSAPTSANVGSSSGNSPAQQSANQLSSVTSANNLQKPPEMSQEYWNFLQEQQRLQKENQLVTMLTNMQQIRHDTKKAVLQNFRV